MAAIEMRGVGFLIFLSVVNTMAHPMPNSIVRLDILRDRITGKAFIPVRDLQAVLGRDANIEEIRDYFLAHVHPKNVAGEVWNVEIVDAANVKSTDLVLGDYDELAVDFVITPPKPESLDDFVFDYDVVCHQVVTHKVFVLVKKGKKQSAGVIELDIPTEKIKPLEIKMSGAGAKSFSILPFAALIVVGFSFAAIFFFSKNATATKRAR